MFAHAATRLGRGRRWRLWPTTPGVLRRAIPTERPARASWSRPTATATGCWWPPGRPLAGGADQLMVATHRRGARTPGGGRRRRRSSSSTRSSRRRSSDAVEAGLEVSVVGPRLDPADPRRLGRDHARASARAAPPRRGRQRDGPRRRRARRTSSTSSRLIDAAPAAELAGSGRTSPTAATRPVGASRRRATRRPWPPWPPPAEPSRRATSPRPRACSAGPRRRTTWSASASASTASSAWMSEPTPELAVDWPRSCDRR